MRRHNSARRAAVRGVSHGSRGRKAVPTLDELRTRRQEILAVAARRGAHNVCVFGSVARGDARADSDIDFVVEFEPGKNVLDLSELILDLEEVLGRRVDVLAIERPSPAAERILREAIAL